MSIFEDKESKKRRVIAISVTIPISCILFFLAIYMGNQSTHSATSPTPGFTMKRMWSGIGPGFGGPNSSPEPEDPPLKYTIDFRVPEGWVQLNSTEFILKDYQNTFLTGKAALATGHQPWRQDPKCAAAACLSEFGIQIGSSIYDISDHLFQNPTCEQYRIRLGPNRYNVDIKIEQNLPIAYHLQIQQ